MKKIISLFLSLTLLISLTAGLDFSAYAEGADDFVYESFDDGSVMITGYTGTEKDVYVPGTLYGNRVFGIASYAFFGCENLKSITISSEIEVVGEYAFSQCTNLTDVNLGTGMLEIGSYAFEGCYSLKRIAVSDVLAIVGEGAFNGCYAVTDIYFPGTQEMWNYVPIEDYFPYSLDNINVHYNSDEIHDYELFETVEPTCTVAGYEKYQCPCGYVRTVEIPETGHNYVNGECTECEIVPQILNLGETKNVSISQAGTYEYFSFVPESDGKYWLYSTGDVDTYGLIYNENWERIARDDDGGFGNNFSLTYDLESGKTYYFGVKLFDSLQVGDFKVTLEEITISSIEYIPVNDVEYIENTNGRLYYNENNEEFYSYDLPYFTVGDILKITDKNGSSVEYEYIGWQYDDECSYFESQDGVRINADFVNRFDDQYTNHWKIGADNYYTVEYFGFSCNVPVAIVENPYSEIIYTPVNGRYELMEGVNGYYMTDDDGVSHFNYEFEFEIGDKITLVSKDGGTEDYIYNDSGCESWDYYYYGAYFENENGDTIYVSVFADQIENYWSVGNEYVLQIECCGLKTTTDVSIIENPVASIEFTPVNPIEYMEETNGCFEYDENGDEFYYYYNPSFEIGDILKVTYKDGRVVEYTYIGWADDSNDYFESSDGVRINAEDVKQNDDQYINHWSLGSDNYFTVEYLAATYSVPVTITENPIASIEFIPVNPVEYIENTNGYFQYDSNGEEYFDYYTPSFEIGDILRINNKDGTIEEYSYIGWQEDLGESYFESSNGALISQYNVNCYSYQYNEHWTVGSDNYYEIEYLGSTCQIPVTIKESPFVSAVYTPVNGSYNLTEGIDSTVYYDRFDEEFNFYNLSFEHGDKITLVLNDGSSVVYSYNENNGWVYNNDDYIETEFENDNGELVTVRISYDQYENHWQAGKSYELTVECMGVTTTTIVNILENPISSIEFIPIKPIEYKENINGYYEYDNNGEKYFYYYLPSFEIGDVLRINNKDGSVIDYTYIGWQESYGESVFLSSNGDCIFEYDINTSSNQFENHWTLGDYNYYQIEYFGANCDVPVSITEINIKSIEYIRANSDIVEFTNGYRRVYYDEDGVLCDYYEYNINVSEGDIFKVVCSDNTVEEYVCYKETAEYEDGTKYDYYELRSENGEVIDVNHIDFSYIQSYDNCWTVGNSYPVQVAYGGHNATFNVNITEHTHNYHNGFCTYCFALEDGYDLPAAKIGKNNVEIDEADEMIMFSYTPKSNGTVNIFSTGSYDTVGYLYDSNMKLVAYNDDNDSGNFGFDYYMQANETYYIVCCMYDDYTTGDFTLNISQLDGVDFEVLEYVIEMINALSADDYSQESYNALIALLNTVPDDLSSLSQTEVDAYATQLLEGMYNLVAYLNLSLSAENGAYTVTVNDSQSSNSSYSVLYGDSVTVNAQANDGYKFVGWYDTVSGIYKSNNAEYTFKMTANTSLKAVFVQEDSATLTFTTYSNWIEKEITNTVTQWNEITSIEELLPDVPYRYGYSNGRWVYDNDEVLAKLRAGENVSIVAEYDADDTSLPTPPSPDGDTPVLDLYYKLDADENIGSFVMAAGLPENCKVESIGIAFYYDNANRFDPTRFELLINNKTFESSFSTEELEDTYIVNVERFTSKDNWAARGYVTYYDSEGNLKTVYSDQINIVKREQV